MAYRLYFLSQLRYMSYELAFPFGIEISKENVIANVSNAMINKEENSMNLALALIEKEEEDEDGI